jgi:drug/metabolite transporter (DMT)-like permease
MADVSMPAHSRAWFQIHVCVVLWGFTAILGRLITLRALPLVWWRMLLVTVALAAWPPFWRGLRQLPRRLALIYVGIGALVTLHWITFYGSIKLSNASVAATCMALTPVFVSFIEPALARRRPNLTEVGMSLAVLPGVALVVGGTPAGMRDGILVGAFSAFVAGLFSTLNKRTIGNSPALTVTGCRWRPARCCCRPSPGCCRQMNTCSCGRTCATRCCSSGCRWRARCSRTRSRSSRYGI